MNQSGNEPKLKNIRRKQGWSLVASVLLSGLMVNEAAAFSFEVDDPDLKIRWDNTLKYTAAWRTKDPDLKVASGNGASPNTDYGDLAYKSGLINNRVDVLSEFDLTYKNVGFRVSGAAWYDDVYRRKTNDYPAFGAPPNTLAGLTGPNNVNSKEVRDLMGKRAEFLDSFVYGRFQLAEDSAITIRAGQHTQLYGETLFLGANGIAAAQGPVDLIKAYSLPNAQFKEIAMPVGQVSTDIQLNRNVSIGAYYQYDWDALRLPATGSYFSGADFVGAGGNLLLIPFPPFIAPRQSDLSGSDSGNYGARVKFKIGDTEYGLYAARYDEKSPIAVLDAPSATYRLMYARDVKTYGASFSTVFGDANVAGELSIRKNTPLAPAGDLVVNFLPNADNKDNTPYARGDTLHFNLSTISVLPATPLWEGATFVGELGFNRQLKVTHDPLNAQNTTHTRDSSMIRMTFTPEYFQVFPGVDLQVPIGLGYGISGRSAVLNIIPRHGGDFSLGINADIEKKWKAGLNFTHYFGDESPLPAIVNGAATTSASYKQYYADRDFINFTFQRTF